MDVKSSEHLERFLQAQIEGGLYASEAEALRAVQEWAGDRLGADEASESASSPPRHEMAADAGTGPRFLEAIDALMKDVSEEELARLPEDGAKNLDHTLYGAPKRQ